MPGGTTDFDFLEEQILALHKQVNLAEFGFDQALIPDLTQRLEKSGLKILNIKQGYALSPAIQRIEKLIIDHRWCMYGHPVANWSFSNVQLRVGPIKADVQSSKR